jgi:hypothetical protein
MNDILLLQPAFLLICVKNPPVKVTQWYAVKEGDATMPLWKITARTKTKKPARAGIKFVEITLLKCCTNCNFIFHHFSQHIRNGTGIQTNFFVQLSGRPMLYQPVRNTHYFYSCFVAVCIHKF